MKNYLLIFPIFIFFIISFNGCKNTRKDLSLSTAELQKMGLPDCNTTWLKKEYSEAFYVLLNVKNSTPFSLPLRGSEKSGEVFAQLINKKNMAFVNNDTIPLSLRAHAIYNFYGVYEDIADLYFNVLLKEQYYTTELALINIFGLDVAQNMIAVGHKINKSEDSDDVAMKSGFASIQSLYLDVLYNALDENMEILKYETDDLETLCEEISLSVQKNLDWFDDTTKENIKQKINLVLESTTSEKIKAEYTKLIGIL